MLETRRSDTSVIEDIGEDVALEDNEIHLRKIQQRVEKERFLRNYGQSNRNIPFQIKKFKKSANNSIIELKDL